MTVSATPAIEPQPRLAEKNDALPQAAPLPASQLALIKATVPVLQQHGEAITKVMYDTLITDHPDLRDIFSSTSQTTGRQPRALARAVLAYATYIDDLPKLTHAVERIAQKHVSLYVRPEQYDVVGEYLIRAIGTVLGEDVATPDIVAAWTAAYGVLASVFIGREEELYRADGPVWRDGWREFRIARKVVEAEGIVSFWLESEPVDGKMVPLPGFFPGQYVSVQVDVPALGHKQSRQFSLSSEPGFGGGGGGGGDGEGPRYYRVSVKRERSDGVAGQEDGVVTNLLHDEYHEGDTVRVSHPHGEFFLDPSDVSKEGHPLVLISAGVGATPLVSMLKAFSTASTTTTVKRPVSWIHTSRSREALPFGDEMVSAVGALKEKGVGPVGMHVHLTQEAGSRLDLATLQGPEMELFFLQDARAEYFVCGPEEFMVEARRTLVEKFGVGKERVYLELFATGDVED